MKFPNVSNKYLQIDMKIFWSEKNRGKLVNNNVNREFFQ